MFVLDKNILFVLILASIAVIALSGCIEPTVCGNGICEIGESASSCPTDCQLAVCPDGECQPPETTATCPQDCKEATGGLKLTVFDSQTMQPIQGAVVEITMASYNEVINTDSNGLAIFKNLIPGSYFIEVRKQGYQTDLPSAPILVSAGGERLASIILNPLLNRFCEGETIKGLEGTGSYAGQEISVKLAAITQPASSESYAARFDLYDSKGILVDSQTVPAEVYLNKIFLDSEGAYALGSRVYISELFVEPDSGKGCAIIEILEEEPEPSPGPSGGGGPCGEDGYYQEYVNGCFFEGNLGQSCYEVCLERGGCVQRYEDSTDLVNACLHWHPGAEDYEVSEYNLAFPYWSEEYNGHENACVSRKYPAPRHSCFTKIEGVKRACKCVIAPNP